MTRARAGVTLIELLVVLVILSLVTGATAMALRVMKDDAPSLADRIVAAKREAITRGEPVQVRLRGSSQARLVTAYPDGRVIGSHDALKDSTDNEGNDARR
jgi:prepilin-type N-terminal cleavage/methylation domain-containing protein